MPKNSHRGSSLLTRLIMIGLLYLGAITTCAPPGIKPSEELPLITVDEIYRNVAGNTDRPVRIRGQLISTFYLGGIGGFYFLQSADGSATILGFTESMLPEEGSTVLVHGLIRPFICQGDLNMLYVKTETMEVVVSA